MRTTLLATLVLLAPAAAFAQAAAGDAAAGEEHFNRQCIACHVVQNEAGEVLAGRSGHVGPNLYGVAGRQAGSWDDFAYSDLMKAYGATGAVWAEENFVPYVQDPTGFLREATGETSGRSKMAFQVRDEQEAHDLWAFLATFSAEGATGGEEGEADSDDAEEGAEAESQ
ncbi:Cytochrome c2 [Rubellimicrobium mesophilum DSM 19309]|uniref:Cytochrome c2 n=1 Tax=Rubellimicrobium mesophilum DSM 19309 TaxID=442562 RepID=A0A017HLH5_9RHOB|nr:c-type cytochrome [Rubellimicrobium mesophilum]EYD75211.1 Cytochrome c2 [Rubellimicrobium mesophilum DSM 19309]